MNKTDSFFEMRNPQYIKGLEDMIDYIDKHIKTKNLFLVEIGSYIGESTTIFAKNFNKVISIDPHIDGYDMNDPACHHISFNQVYKKFIENVSKHENISHIRKLSDDAVIMFNNESIDVLYIDGLHTYEQVKKDIENYLPKIKKGGFICGHDYHDNWIGVKQAINETIGYVDKVFIDTSWLTQIK
jgi:predicted O-methyltransferase YrrM